MKLLNYFEQIQEMTNRANKFDIRLQMVKHTIVYSIQTNRRSLYHHSQDGAKMAIFL